MKPSGIIRNIDKLGRLVVPKEMRDFLGIEKYDPVEIFLEGDKIILKRFDATCIFCSSSEKLFEFEGKMICPACLKKLTDLKDRLQQEFRGFQNITEDP